MELSNIIKNFKIEGDIINIVPYGEGHINDTFLVKTSKNDYILQRVETKIFKDIEGLMNNIILVTEFLKEEIKKSGGDINRETLNFIKTKDNKSYITIDNNVYRAMLFVSNSITYQIVEDKNILENAGKSLGQFISRLDSFDAKKLVEIIPNFHNTKLRFENFEKSLKLDIKDRAKNCKEEIDFVKQRKLFSSIIIDKLDNFELPLRVTHNDTKLNNILFDKKTNEAICIIDLDTIMPGTLLWDFGDAVRFACSTAKEDEKDLSKVDFDINLYESFTKGFLEGIQNKITLDEVKMLHIGAMMMTFECGMRFLTDYLDGDIYFKTAYQEHNLVRAKTQFKLVDKMKQCESKMVEIAYKYYKN